MRNAEPVPSARLLTLLTVVEPDLVQTKITLKGDSGPAVAALWREVSKRFEKSLSGFTVAQLAADGEGSDWEI